MKLEEIQEILKRDERTLYAPRFNKKIEIEEVTKENGRHFGIYKDGDKTKKIDIRYLEKENKIKKVVSNNKPKPFPEEKRAFLEKKEEKTFEALRLLGRNRLYVIKILAPEMENSMKKTMMTKYGHTRKDKNGISEATVRAKHYANTAMIAYKIAEGLFPGDKELALGIATCALYHDYGQDPFGHNGEKALENLTKYMNGGLGPHGTLGADDLRYREFDKIKDAINSGAIIEEEAKKRVRNRLGIKETDEIKTEDFSKYNKEVKQEIKNIKQNLELGLEVELENKIEQNAKQNGELTDEAIKLIIMSAGNHNGERGIANIKPNYELTYEDFCENIRQTYIDPNAANRLDPCTIADAIVKLSDQISSIPFDMIDGVRSGMEDEIPDEWITPVSQFLQIPEDEVMERFEEKDNKSLEMLALEIQEKAIESVIRCSNQREINMDLSDFLYGNSKKEIVGLRGPNINQHIIHTSTKKESDILLNSVTDLVEVMVNQLLDDKGALHPELNALFRVSAKNPIRKNKEKQLLNKYAGQEELKPFFKYCTELSPEEYQYIKSIVKDLEMKRMRGIIEECLNNNNQNYYVPQKTNDSIKYAIEIAISSNEVELVSPDKNGKYSEEKIKTMIENINAFLKVNPVDGVDRIKILANIVKYDEEKEITEKRTAGRDRQIATELAIKYIAKLNDDDFVELCKSLEIMKEEEVKLLRTPYDKCSTKRKGESGYVGKAEKDAEASYKAAQAELNDKQDDVPNGAPTGEER